MPDEFYTWFNQTFGANASDDLMAYMRKEVMQAVWALLLNPEFIHAYFHGFEWKFWDGIIRLVFLRILAQCADYPERCVYSFQTNVQVYSCKKHSILLMCLKYFSKCPCPRCLIPKELIYKLGTAWERKFRAANMRTESADVREAIRIARQWVFGGAALRNEHVEAKLAPKSLTISRVRTPTPLLLSVNLHLGRARCRN